MAVTPAFLDTNILLYGYNLEDPRSEIAQQLATEPYVISVQVLNEFANVALRRLRLDWDRIELALSAIARAAAGIPPITLAAHRKGVAIARRHKLQVYDGVLVASALEAGCALLWSEDMHDGLVVDERLTIRNPFG